ncbi:MAG: pilD [Gemmatimonadetes bacterium]|nr:pilD [Gemmatimonadota bacterium]
MPLAVLYVYAGIVGACVGSFLNVCVYRWPADQSVVTPRSRCGSCRTQLGWRDNIPVFGWIFLRGRCRYCGAKVSVQYPLVELATALLWVAAALRFGFTLRALGSAVFFTTLLGIALSDARTYIIPDEFTLGGLVIGLAFAFVPGGIGWRRAAIGAAVGFGLLWLVAVLGKLAFKKDAMGGGDIKMMAMVGAFLGPVGVLLTVFLGAAFGSLIFAPISIKTGKLVPFGIFLALGAAVTEPWGQALVHWYSVHFLGG